MSRNEVEQQLVEQVERTRKVYKSAHAVFNSVSSEIPSGLPHPDGAERIRIAGEEYYASMAAYNRALREFNSFVLEGVIPDRLNPGSSE